MSKRRGGPASKFAYNPAALVAYLDSETAHTTGGHPVRTRRTINGFPVRTNDARMIRRWRDGKIEGVTAKSCHGLLDRHGLNAVAFITWAEARGLVPILRGN